MKKTVKAGVLNLCIFLLSLLILVPVCIVVLNSFKTQGEAASFTLSLPTKWIMDNYREVFATSDIWGSMRNGIVYSGFSSVGVMMVSAMAAFVLSRRRTGGCNKFYYLFMAGLVLPMSIIPTIMTTKQLHLYGTYLNLILLYIAFNIPFCVFMYYGFMETIPSSLDEATLIDGGGAVSLFFRVILPLLKPVTVTSVLIIATGIWNDFYYQLYFTRSSDMWAMPMTVYNYFGQYSRSWNLVCADIVIAVVPILIVFILFQKQIVDGMTVGAVKG
ncbi:carbohydrate ABC transporter permease [Diplocloster agilis]|uniref:Carbohydrate ABC transporter permease n=1 Tax=Diplocloster agilis TaxID=2850323 RepID=A0A949JY38_9FIRM|nr:carbohydrate ABC transporter permease [Diplocloster agilis]MBU9737330.1 carbohydrate ABC transporter permease [Diplocloster agilis]